MKRISFIALSVIAALAAALVTPRCAFGENLVEVSISGEPPLPMVIERELDDIFSGTLSDVLFGEGENSDLSSEDSIKLADAITLGINIVIEPRGYTVANLTLDLNSQPVHASFLVHPTGWTPDDPHAVTGVDVRLSDHGLTPFWVERFTGRIEEHDAELAGILGQSLLGLPARPVDETWALGLVMPEVLSSDPVREYFPDFDVSYSVDLGPTAVVNVELEAGNDLIELVRPRMYSRTLYNIILDRMRERLLTGVDLIQRMPRAELESAREEIARVFENMLTEDPVAKQFDAYASVEIALLPDEPVARVDAVIESRRYDLSSETFVDIGNESSDSAEVQSRFGYLFARGIEIFVNLNYFTNDSTLETDAALGLRPSREVFFAAGYDFERRAPKYFFAADVSTGLRVRGEIFEDDTLNEFGLTYQFQQYLSAGFYTNGNNEYWVRAIFAL
jgi:hypothetical protein